MLSRKIVAFVVVAGLLLLGSTLVIAQDASDEARKQAQANEKVIIDGPLVRNLEPDETAGVSAREGRQIPVAIVYDDGVVTAVPAVSSFCYGNQFNSASGSTVTGFSVTMLSFYMMSGAGSDSVFVSLYGPVSGTMAPFIEDIFVPLNNGSAAFNTVTLGPYVGSGSFLAGVWYVGGDTVGLGAGTVGGQGHHGMAINDIVGTGFATLPSLNALVGVSTAFVPVELMQFTIE